MIRALVVHRVSGRAGTEAGVFYVRGQAAPVEVTLTDGVYTCGACRCSYRPRRPSGEAWAACQHISSARRAVDQELVDLLDCRVRAGRCLICGGRKAGAEGLCERCASAYTCPRCWGRKSDAGDDLCYRCRREKAHLEGNRHLEPPVAAPIRRARDVRHPVRSLEMPGVAGCGYSELVYT